MPSHDLLTLFLLTQSRADNIPLFLLSYSALQILISLDLEPNEISVTSIVFQYASFFMFGGSNGISSIDLSNAYNGVDNYNAIAVGVLTFVGNWAGPLWWAFATNSLLRGEGRGVIVEHLAILTMFTASHLFFVMVACTVLRAHLFIWTVFSPKYMYSIVWCLGQHFSINMFLGSCVFWFGTK